MLDIKLKTCSLMLLLLLLDASNCFPDRRVQESLQNANADFLNIEGSAKPASSPVPQNPNQKNEPPSSVTSTTPKSSVRRFFSNINERLFGSDKQKNETPTPTPAPGKVSSTTPSTTVNTNKQTIPAVPNSNNRQKNNGDALPLNTNNQQSNSNQRPVPNSPTPQGSSTPLRDLSFPTPANANVPQNNKQNSNGGAVVPNNPQSNTNQRQPPNPTPRQGSTTPLRDLSFPSLPNANGPQNNNQHNMGNNAWNRNNPQQPGPNSPTPQGSTTPLRDLSFPILPTRGGPQGGTTQATTTTRPRSWSSIVSGNNNNQVNNPQSSGISNPSIPNPTPNVRPNTPSVPGQNRPAVTPPVAPGSSHLPGSPTAATKELVSDEELKETSEALLRKDTNNAAKYITVNYQAKTSSFSKDDLAPQPLFTFEPAVWNIPTIAAMKVLFDNYEQDTTVNEHITPQERNEENAFMDAIMSTSVIRHLMSFLLQKGLVSPDPKDQRDLLKSIWFNMYSRGQGRIGSSGFEHIFLSELKNGEISGLHSWIYFQTEEEAQRANYLGYLKKVDLRDKGAILKLHFNFKGIDKPVDTMFVGTSPELEIALYSLCFITRADKACPLTLGDQPFNLRTHTFRYRSKNMIGSAFPEI